jgi:hypothetical protein
VFDKIIKNKLKNTPTLYHINDRFLKYIANESVTKNSNKTKLTIINHPVNYITKRLQSQFTPLFWGF